MYINEGSQVIITDVDQPGLARYVGTTWTVKNVISAYHPATALLYHQEYGEITLPVRNLETIPPEGSALFHNEYVQILKPYARDGHHVCRTELVGKTGKVRGFDTRNGYFFIKTTSGESGWFPIQSLLPLSFKGEKFYYPDQEVLHEGVKVKISKIKRTKFGKGLLLFINGDWIPSSEVSLPAATASRRP